MVDYDVSIDNNYIHDYHSTCVYKSLFEIFNVYISLYDASEKLGKKLNFAVVKTLNESVNEWQYSLFPSVMGTHKTTKAFKAESKSFLATKPASILSLVFLVHESEQYFLLIKN